MLPGHFVSANPLVCRQWRVLTAPPPLSEGAIASTEVKLKLQEFLLSKKEPGISGLNHSFSPKCW